VSEDWSAVAQAISNRMAELGISQRELIERSHLSKAIVREIQHDVVRRRRSARTLEALSTALDWHAGYLAAVLTARRPPRVGEPICQI
jgi:transcriptional regulator with XRE-family HTH domain